jgi:hypothetical protein
MKLTSTILILAITATAFTQTSMSGCVYASSDRDECVTCYKRNRAANAQGKMLCAAEALPEEDHCVFISGRNDEKCTWCDPGFLRRKDDPMDKCVAATSTFGDDCVRSVETSPGTEVCSICNMGFPTNQDCVKFNGEEAAQFCEWGARRSAEQGGTPRCMRCIEGYYKDSDSDTCVAEGDNTVGCWIGVTQEGVDVCRICDPWKGYRFDDDFMNCMKDENLAREMALKMRMFA